MFIRAKILYTTIILLAVFKGFSQPQSLTIIPTDTVLKEYSQPRVFISISEIKKQLQKELIKWQRQNYLEAAFDSIIYDSLNVRAWLHLGDRYNILQKKEWERKGKKHSSYYSSSGYGDWIKIIEKKIRTLEQNGYPFAQVTVKPIVAGKNSIEIQLKTDSGEYITYDTLIITGSSVQDKLFLIRYLNIKPNTAYNEKNIMQLDKQLQQLPFIKVVRPSSVYFYQNKAQVIICIDDKPSNNFEGILGIRNDEVNAKQYKITGDVNLQLNNVLASAASLKLQWRRLAAQNSDLSCMGYYPYLLGAPVALNDEFSLFRQDSNFQRLKNIVGFSYLFSGLNALQFYYSYEKSTATLTPQQKTEAIEFNMLPSVNDYLNKNYGVKVTYKNLDNIFNPTRGVNLIIDASTGTHRIIENAVLKESRGSNGKKYSVYDSLPKQKGTFQTFGLADLYYPFSRRHVVNVFMQGASMYHPQIFYNEQFQLGGLKTFRGVNELGIKATSYALLRTEYRYILPQTGYFSLFCNGIWYESTVVNNYRNTTLFGFGGGLGLQTKGGILTLVYALANENGFILKLGKVHIGFTAVF